jgi:hypothetical protein
MMESFRSRLMSENANGQKKMRRIYGTSTAARFVSKHEEELRRKPGCEYMIADAPDRAEQCAQT